MSTIKSVMMHQTTDGQVYSTLEVAESKQRDIDVIKKLTDLVEAHCYRDMSTNDITGFIFECEHEILEIIK